jgi:class 3 adenylate cyclase/streptogramin lyase
MIADVRGYTAYTRTYGDEAAGELAARFADVVRAATEAAEGRLVETRGDEALAAFSSARRAVGAAIDLQRRLRLPAESTERFPLGVGVGLDAGEAVPVAGGFRGSALNVAARLCAAAAGGQVLATENVVHLAGATPGVRYGRRRSARLKGVERSIVIVDVESVEPLPAPPEPAYRGGRRRRVVAVVVALMVVGIAATAAAIVRSGASGDLTRPTIALHPNSVAVFDIKAGRVIRDIPVGHGAAEIAAGDGLVWVANVNENSVSLIDPKSYAARTVGIGITPNTIAFGHGAAWAADGSDGTAVSIYPDRSFNRFSIPGCGDGCGAAIAATNRAVWLGVTPAGPSLHGGTVDILDVRTKAVLERVERVPADRFALSSGSLWAYGGNGFWLSQIDLHTHDVLSRKRLPPTAAQGVYTSPGVAYGYGYAWAVSPLGALYRVTPDGRHVRTITIPAGGSGVAAGAGSIWVADEAGSLLRVDPAEPRIIDRYRLGQEPLYVTVAYNRVWITLTGS